jgi:hypothetical protein
VIGSGDIPAHREEAVPAGEREAISRVVELTRRKLEADYAVVRPVRRDQHPKMHGCVKAEFIVGDDVPPDLRYGLFAAPGAYLAWIRFSSAATQPQPDSKRDAHGMAIKVMGVAGDKVLEAERHETTQDFIIANNDAFFCRNAADYVELATKMSEGRLLTFFFGPNPARWRVHEFANMLRATQKKVRDPLQIRYWSQTPYALGPHAVKYSVTPQDSAGDRGSASSGANHLEVAMVHRLSSAETSFDVLVQRRADPRRMPVEDPTIVWRERDSPFHRVATIRIPAQVFTSQAQKNFAERLSLTPWHTLPEHRPLGGINRVRAAVYEATSLLRHELNGAPRREPTGHEEF